VPFEPDLVFNSKTRPFKRCSTHVSIAYFIYFQQRYQILQRVFGPDFIAKQSFVSLNLDPTYDARFLKASGGWGLAQNRVSPNFGNEFYSSRDISGLKKLPQQYLPSYTRTHMSSHTPSYSFQKSAPYCDMKEALNAKQTKIKRRDFETLLDNALDRVNLFPKIIVHPEDVKFNTVVNPNLLAMHEIKTTPISSLQSQLPIDQKDHTEDSCYSVCSTDNKPSSPVPAARMPSPKLGKTAKHTKKKYSTTISD